MYVHASGKTLNIVRVKAVEKWTCRRVIRRLEFPISVGQCWNSAFVSSVDISFNLDLTYPERKGWEAGTDGVVGGDGAMGGGDRRGGGSSGA